MSENTEIATTEDTFSFASLSEDLQAKILAASEQLKNSAVFTVNKIRNDAKSFIFPDGFETQEFSGIIVAARHANIHYANEYKEGESNPPDCVAVSEQKDVPNNDLKPNSIVVEPYCASNCGACSKLQWGSDKGGKGRGKECAEFVLLAIAVPALGDDLYLLECKKGNAKTADGYLALTTNKFGHPITVLTKFSMGTKTKWNQEFVSVSSVSSDLVTNLAKRIDEADSMLISRVTSSYKQPTTNETSTTQDLGRVARER